MYAWRVACSIGNTNTCKTDRLARTHIHDFWFSHRQTKPVFAICVTMHVSKPLQFDGKNNCKVLADLSSFFDYLLFLLLMEAAGWFVCSLMRLLRRQECTFEHIMYTFIIRELIVLFKYDIRNWELLLLNEITWKKWKYINNFGTEGVVLSVKCLVFWV